MYNEEIKKKLSPNVLLIAYDLARTFGNSLIRLLKLCSWLSIDVVLGAMICNYIILQIMQISPVPWIQIYILGITVWAIYLLDHLWDIKKTTALWMSERRMFFCQNQKILAYFTFFLFMVALVTSMLFLHFKIICFGLCTGALVILYFYLVHIYKRKWHSKEVVVSLLYSVGVWGSAALSTENIKMMHLVLWILFGLIAFINLIIFSWYELEEDRKTKQSSFVLGNGEESVKKILYTLFGCILILGGFAQLFATDPLIKRWLMIQWLMVVILFCLMLFPMYFKNNDSYRWIGDGIFCLPLILNFID